MTSGILEKIHRFYFIGIGGVSMSALVKYLLVCGKDVSGSDAVKGETTQELLSFGVRVHIGENAENEDLKGAEAVVYTSAIQETHSELIAARAAGKTVWKRSELLKYVCGEFAHVAAVAGSHGKTTCTAMCAHILAEAHVPFAAHIGGEDSLFGNFTMSGKDFFVTEACEYKKNLLEIEADTKILLNIDRDHMECYRDMSDLEETFYRYLKGAKTAFLCADDERCKKMKEFFSFGIENPLSDYRAVELKKTGEKYAFTVSEYGKSIARVKLNTVGRCNVYNALAAFAAMRSYGFGAEEIARGIESFTAVKRRFEKIGTFAGAAVICDYAHHPKEIAATTATAKQISKKKLYVVFQPHTYSRTKLLMGEFVETLRGIEHLMIYKTYPAREYYDEAGSAKTLAANVGNCLYAESVRELKSWLKNTVEAGDLVLFLGAGDIYYAAQCLVRDSK